MPGNLQKDNPELDMEDGHDFGDKVVKKVCRLNSGWKRREKKKGVGTFNTKNSPGTSPKRGGKQDRKANEVPPPADAPWGFPHPQGAGRNGYAKRKCQPKR